MTSKYLLDTSALAVHALRGTGHELVADCLRKGAAACALTCFELTIFLRTQGVEDHHARQAWGAYRTQLRRLCPVDEAVVALALDLRWRATARLPLVDACIAACAVQHGLTLLHCDRHFAALPADVPVHDLREEG
jgi:predicted nucleic acid-binding protein